MISPGQRGALVTLLHLCDSLFPVGGFAHSDGLEAATARHEVANARDLGEWMDAMLDGMLATCDGPAILTAWEAASLQDWAAVEALDEEVHALRPSAAARQASRGMGARLQRTWEATRRQRVGPPAGLPLTFPVAFGVIAAAAQIDRRSALDGYIYNRLAAAVSAAMRLAPVGQIDGHTVLADVLSRVPKVVDAILERRDPPMTFAPALDMAAMNQQYLHSRLFRS